MLDNIKIIREEHLLECAKLYVEVFNSAPWNDKWTVEKANKRLQDIYLSTNFFGIVYIEQNKIIGAIFGNIEQYYEGLHYNLREMFISTSHQGTGLGSNMMIALEKQLKEQGVTNTYLFTSKGDKVDRFYVKNGFRELDFMCMMFKDL